MSIPLEDNAGDIIGKAQRGLGISDSELAQKSGVSVEQIRKARSGDVDAKTISQIAPVLKLNARALQELAAGQWRPADIVDFAGLTQFSSNYGDMAVNSYLVWDTESRNAIAFDTGADCGEMLRRAGKEKLSIKTILLTHAHPDHVADLARLREETGAHIYISAREAIPGAEAIEEGKEFRAGKIEIESRLTFGHSPGGMTFVVRGLTRPIAIVGDSMFAGSMGGGNFSYEDALRNNIEKILSLPDDTIVCPGHGPMTTVGEEKMHNAFFTNV